MGVSLGVIFPKQRWPLTSDLKPKCLLNFVKTQVVAKHPDCLLMCLQRNHFLYERRSKDRRAIYGRSTAMCGL